MNSYHFITVSNLIGKGIATDLYLGELGFVHLRKPSFFLEEIKGATVDAYSFLLVQKGSADIEINMCPLSIQEGEILLLTPFSVIGASKPSDDFSALCLLEGRTLFERIPNYGRFHGLLNRTDISKIMLDRRTFGQIEQTFSTFASYISRKHTFQEGLTLVLSDFLLLQLCEELYALQKDIPLHIERKDELLHHFFSLLSVHHREQHGIQFYADKLSVSTTYLSRIIRETTRKTAYYYIGEKLFTSARHLLACTDYTVAEIASQMNFSDQSAFGKFFKSKAGVSLAQYRVLLGRKNTSTTS